MTTISVPVKEKNKIIGVFVGWELSRHGKRFSTALPPRGYAHAHPEHLKFHISWDWLKIALDKVDTVNAMSTSLRLSVKASKVLEMPFNCLIEEIHDAVYEFADWYLKNKKDLHENH